jgi:hypothetical protein
MTGRLRKDIGPLFLIQATWKGNVRRFLLCVFLLRNILLDSLFIFHKEKRLACEIKLMCVCVCVCVSARACIETSPRQNLKYVKDFHKTWYEHN